MLDIFPKALKPAHAADAFAAAEGDMAERMRRFDWSRTALGVPESWPFALRHAVRMLLSTPEPACLWWGESCVNIPNEACLALLGAAHATSLGVPGRAAWGDLWRDLERGVERAMREAAIASLDPVAIPLDRGGIPHESHFAATFVPVLEGEGGPSGVLATFRDATPSVLAQRETALLRELVARTEGAASFAETAQRLAEALATNAFDLPFSGTYLADEGGEALQLVVATGIAANDPLMPAVLPLEGSAPYPAADVMRSQQLRIVPLAERPFGAVPTGPWSRPPHQAALVPLGRGALWIAALNPFRALDEVHRRFLSTVAAQISAALAQARLHDAERRRIESERLAREVRAGERRYRELLEALPAAIYTTDDQGRLMLWNNAASSLWGREPLAGMERFCGAHLVFTTKGEKLPLEETAIARVLKGEAPASGEEVVIERPDGSVRHVLVNVAPLRDEQGRITGAVNMLVDISQRRTAEAELAATKDELAAQVESLTMLHELAVRLGGMDQVGAALKAVVDTAVEAQGAMSGLVWLHDPRTGELVVEAERGFDGDRTRLFTRVAAGTQGGSAGNAFARRTRWVVTDTEADPLFEPYREAARAAGFRSVHSTPIVTRAGELLGVLSVHFARRHAPTQRDRQVADVCARHAADVLEALRSLTELRELDQRKDEFLATLAHELRNPLAPLRNGLEVMRLASGNPATVEKARSMMERQLGQMVRLVDDLLDVSRVSRGKIELRRERVELATVLRNAMETSQPLMGERGHDLVAAIPRERIVVDADVTRLSQVFWNLLNNAAKYTEPGGKIELGVRMEGGEVAVAIRDNGIGIPPDMQSRVFDIFTQVDRSLEKSQGGLGIGLSIAKRLVEMHGGTIQVRSGGHRQGSEFIVRLPATVESPRERPRDEARGDARPAAMRKRILVADDNSDSASTLSLILEVLGNDVRVVHDGEAAVAAASEFDPDMILLDIGMPKLNGYGACERIRREAWGARPYIVALTGWGQEGDKHRSKAAGFDRHLVKPVEPAMLEKLIATLPTRPAAGG